MSRGERCPRGGDHIWVGSYQPDRVWCVACNKTVTFAEMMEIEGMGESLLIPALPEPSKLQSPKRGNFSGRNWWRDLSGIDGIWRALTGLSD